ncbi:MAG: LON peptidase substrate-binding domain-containing protein [Candidatus Methylacidiphilales bacterium]
MESQMGVMLLEGVVLLPGERITLYLFEPRYIALVEEALQGDRIFAVGNMEKERPMDVFGAGLLTSTMKLKNGTYMVEIEGVHRLRTMKVETFDPLLRVSARALEDVEPANPGESIRKLAASLGSLSAGAGDPGSSLLDLLETPTSLSKLIYLLCGVFMLESNLRQKILEEDSVEKRLTFLCAYIDTFRLN